MKSEWIKVEDELPPEDGHYEVTNDPDKYEGWWVKQDVGPAYYDGHGFQYNGIYRCPAYWKKLHLSERTYGKVGA